MSVEPPTIHGVSERFLRRLAEEPFLCFLSHIDWAPESMIANALDFFDEYGVAVTPYVTHESPTIRQRYQGDRERLVGLHPNFLPESTHGRTTEEVIDHVLGLWPTARSFASHCFVDSALIATEFFQRGLRYDSNLCLHLQPSLVPFRHHSGLVRFPVFFADDVYAAQSGNLDYTRVADLFKAPGLKLMNFHPVHISLNTPNVEYYRALKRDLREWPRGAFGGRGLRTFLDELMQDVHAAKLATYYLDDLARAAMT